MTNRDHITGLVDQIREALHDAQRTAGSAAQDAEQLIHEVNGALVAAHYIDPQRVEEAHDVLGLHNRLAILKARLETMRHELDVRQAQVEKVDLLCNRLMASVEEPEDNTDY
jgi:hypothetical protein